MSNGEAGEPGEAMTDLATRSKDTQAAVLSLGMLNETYRSREGEAGREECVGGRGVEEEKSSLAPVTPQRADRPNPGSPLTPLANLKVLIAAASSAMERECAPSGRGGDGVDRGGSGDDGGGRKMKSLSVLCQRFLSIAETEVGVGNDFSLELMSQNLGTNRRRIYDIINVLEALEMIVKQSKNWYTWLGRENLLLTLAKMRAMAADDPDFRHLHALKENTIPTPAKGKEDNQVLSSLPLTNKTNLPTNSSSSTTKFSTKTDKNEENCSVTASQPPDVEDRSANGSQVSQQKQLPVVVCDEVMPSVCGACGGNGSGGRWDKSLGVLCQKFVMLFLVTPEHQVTLDYAGNMLMPDCVEGNPFAAMHQSTNPKTKVRRLYDIANVLTTLGLIKKKTFLAPNHRKMPGYAWAGPTIEEIQAIPVFRKNEFNLYPFYSKKKGLGATIGGISLSRNSSVGGGCGGVRPFLHQYGVRGQESSSTDTPGDNKDEDQDPSKHSSAPTTPVKSRVVRRTLSFGAQPSKGGSKRINRPSSVSSTSMAAHSSSCSSNTGSPFVPIAPAPPPLPSNSNKCVVARPLAPKQVDYMNEVKEFEAEMRKHSHKFPHVASVFQEFIQKYQSTLEQAASAGRTILPKPVSLDENVSVGYGNSQPVSNINHPLQPPNTIEVTASMYNAISDVPLSTCNITNFTPSTQLEDSQSNLSEKTVNYDTVHQTGATIPSLSSQPPDLIQLGDIDISGVAKPIGQTVPSGRMSPTPTLTSGTRGVLSPGPSGAKAFMSVEDVMIPSPNIKGTQTSNTQSTSPPPSKNKPTMLTALLKTDTATGIQQTIAASDATAQSSVVQQALVSSLLNTLVNQSPIPAPAAFQKPSETVSTANQVVANTSCALGARVLPQVQHGSLQIPRTVSLANAFNPSVFLASPAQLSQQQIISAAAAVSTGSILPPSALLPNMSLSPYLTPFPSIYGSSLATVPPTLTTPDPSVSSFAISGSTGVKLPSIVSISEDMNKNEPSSPKKPRLA